jgi:hypothetical protein
MSESGTIGFVFSSTTKWTTRASETDQRFTRGEGNKMAALHGSSTTSSLSFDDVERLSTTSKTPLSRRRNGNSLCQILWKFDDVEPIFDDVERRSTTSRNFRRRRGRLLLVDFLHYKKASSSFLHLTTELPKSKSPLSSFSSSFP